VVGLGGGVSEAAAVGVRVDASGVGASGVGEAGIGVREALVSSVGTTGPPAGTQAASIPVRMRIRTDRKPFRVPVTIFYTSSEWENANPLLKTPVG